VALQTWNVSIGPHPALAIGITATTVLGPLLLGLVLDRVER
jgi:hypothetical protein